LPDEVNDEPRRLALDFEMICAQILVAAGYHVDRELRVDQSA
jgi:hypothetical protein